MRHASSAPNYVRFYNTDISKLELDAFLKSFPNVNTFEMPIGTDNGTSGQGGGGVGLMTFITKDAVKASWATYNGAYLSNAQANIVWIIYAR